MFVWNNIKFCVYICLVPFLDITGWIVITILLIIFSPIEIRITHPLPGYGAFFQGPLLVNGCSGDGWCREALCTTLCTLKNTSIIIITSYCKTMLTSRQFYKIQKFNLDTSIFKKRKYKWFDIRWYS